MKKIAIIASTLTLMLSFSNGFAAVRVAEVPQAPYTDNDYVGVIVAAEYVTQPSSAEQMVRIITKKDDKNTDNKLKGLTIDIDGNDLPFGLSLASSVGKKIAVIFTNRNYDINFITIITDEYYYGDGKNLKLNHLNNAVR